MSENWTLAGVNVGAPSVTTRASGTTVRVTAEALLVRPRGRNTSVEATVVLDADDGGLPGESPEQQDVKALVKRAIDRAVAEARAAAAAFVEALGTEPPLPMFPAAALRDAYRLGHDRGTYDAGGDPAAYDYESDSFRFCEAADLSAYLGEAPAGEAYDRLLAGQNAPAPAAAA
ncbi:hypothetical protein NS228_05305 [Methylobacterium indicum]|uniref:hypothetical protein n=1 Tax=Methylobacterium indicum TaxID=1775910 RepID=UPI0007340204|nr:hypothetical protein [Methylobacterium indicum]KTS34218.1 hypothetical protein NS229_11420 [Methylobacterium indicum]KTS41798.1 hypothetical protein NS228_05305 [Methylobacterium indicum]KTS53106.1 hypothetical protein NS230_07670 [Methylobacterium indicum]